MPLLFEDIFFPYGWLPVWSALPSDSMMSDKVFWGREEGGGWKKRRASGSCGTVVMSIRDERLSTVEESSASGIENFTHIGHR